jgi:phage terminase large subunit GpA-like protein
LANRTTTFHDGRAIFVSTPTVKHGRIDSLYAGSDQRRYHLTCPTCGRPTGSPGTTPPTDASCTTSTTR